MSKSPDEYKDELENKLSKIIINERLAEIICDTIETFKLVSGSYVGQYFKLTKWQRKFIYDIFTKFRAEDRTRLISEALLTIARKNGKTEFIAALVLCFTIIPHLQQDEAQIIIASGTREQAGIMFNVIRKMIEYDDDLNHRYKIVESKKYIKHLATGMEIQAIAADGNTAMGKNCYLAICDEAGNWAKEKGAYLFEALATSVGAQKEPLIISLSTQSPDNTHFFSKKVDYALKINDENDITEDESFIGHVYSIPEDEDVTEPKNWILSNPSLEDIPTLARTIEREIKKAKYLPTSMATFRQLIANQRYSADAAFMSRDSWFNCKTEYDINELKGCKAYGGLDLSGGRNDLASLQLVVVGHDDSLYTVSYFWSSEEGLFERGERDGVNYMEWKRNGYMLSTPSVTTDWAYMTKALLDICEDFDMQMIYYDRWKFYEIERELGELGEHLPVTPYGQGFRDMSPAVNALEEYIYERKLWHDGNPVLTWNIANSVVSIDPAGLKKLDKKKSFGRIDGAVALAMAARCHQVEGVSSTTEVYFV